jgi:hypothetical protein
MTGATVTLARPSLVCTAVLTAITASLGWSSTVNIARDAEQTDAISGLHWQRHADLQHPAAPPRLVLMPREEHPAGHDTKGRATVCVRAGDRVLLQDANATTATFALEATALGNGVRGDRVRARVLVTGATVEMTVLDAGKGLLTRKKTAWR